MSQSSTKQPLDQKRMAAIATAAITAIFLTTKSPLSHTNPASLDRAAQAILVRDEIQPELVSKFVRDVQYRVIDASFSGILPKVSADSVTDKEIETAPAVFRHLLTTGEYRMTDMSPGSRWQYEVVSRISVMTGEKPSDVIEYFRDAITQITTEQLDNTFGEKIGEPVGAGA